MEAHFGRDLALYTAARVALIAVVTAVLVLVKIPLLVGLAVAVIAAFPLSMLLFRGLNQRVTTAMAERGESRRTERERLRAELRGDGSADTIGEDKD